MEHGFGKLNVTKMAGTGGHVASTRLTLCGPLDYPLPGIHETAELGPTTLHGIGVVNPIRERHRHAFLDKGVGEGVGRGKGRTSKARNYH